MPVINAVSGDFADDVTFLAIGWNSTFEKTEARANDLFTSGNLLWGLDENAEIFGLYGVRGQPVSILIADGKIVDSWSGAAGEEALRESLAYLALFNA